MKKIIDYIKKATKLKEIRIKKQNFIGKCKFLLFPEFSAMSDYEILLDTILQKEVYKLEGDFVEIGAFLGVGTYKLSKLLEALKVDKKVYAIDIFDIRFDESINIDKKKMSEIYKEIIGEENQYEIYRKNIKDCKNVVTIIGDSKKIKLPCKKVSFAFIDGNHSPEYVKSDFYLVWNKMVSKGIVAFDDYGHDLPQVTETIHQIIGEQKDKILKIWVDSLRTIFIQKK